MSNPIFSFNRKKPPLRLPVGFSDAGALLRVAQHLLAEGNADAAQPALVICLDHLPQNADVWIALGMCQAQLGQDRSAVNALRRGVGLAPQRIDALSALGEVHVRLMQFAAAAQALKAAIALDPNATHPQGVRARALADRLEGHLRRQSS